MKFIVATLLVSFVSLGQCALEEFVVRGPNELHNVAIDTFIDERRKNPEIKDMGDDSPLMKRARNYAIKRFTTQREEDISLMVHMNIKTIDIFQKFDKYVQIQGENSEGALLALPSPDEQQSFLTAAVTTKAASYEVMAPGDLTSLQVGILEDIGNVATFQRYLTKHVQHITVI